MTVKTTTVNTKSENTLVWQQIHVQCDKANVALAESLLMEYESLSIVLEDAGNQPLFEPLPGMSPLWDEVVLTGLFTFDKLIDFEAMAQNIASESNARRVWSSTVDDTDWEREWMSHYQPIECANDLWIVPKWLTPPKPTAINIIMDPGLAFGTGYHATTRLCLDWLTEQDLTDKIIIDYGCGSGILGIAALLLGAKQVYAIDIDPQAVLASNQNAERNQVSKNFQSFLPQEFKEFCQQTRTSPVDMITANILAKPLMTLAPYFATLLKPEGDIVLAGLIEGQIDEVMATFTQNQFDIGQAHYFDNTNDKHWIRLSGKLINC